MERAGSRKAWEYRWYEVQPDGSRRRRNLVLGTLEQYPNETAAQRAVAALRADINAESPRMNLTPMSVQTLVEHYREKELGEDSGKTYATCRTYQGYFRKWILPRWGQYKLKDVRSVAVEEWLRSLKLSNGSKAKMRNIMHAVFNHAIRWEWHERNPITHVRQSAKRSKVPIVLDVEEIAALLQLLKEPARTAVFLDVMTGLRVGELLALKWNDIGFEKSQISVTRSIVMQHIGDCKTEASRKPVPLDSRLADALSRWQAISPYPQPEDWVFASPHSNGRLPYWPGAFYRAHILPAAKILGIEGIGWHTFRRTYATLLKANGEDVKTVQELLRHANSLVTMNLYAQAITQNKRDAQSKIVSMLFDKKQTA
ncbi:tyrosine-type recombinase/integrase [Telmatobacter bradus]|uniref:tyrosine-type recombinase/integrase n=1 Tax=Telmatobacter bradus TaxID=474953 RepID=UPI003B429196